MPRKPRKRKLSTAKKAAWDWLSKCIRYSHASDGIHAACVTCGTVKPWTQLHAGHFVPKKAGSMVAFMPENIHPQCPRCNMFEAGNLHNYDIYMEREYGRGVIDRLREMRGVIVNWKACDYDEMATFYREQFERMLRDRAEGITGKLEVIPWA